MIEILLLINRLLIRVIFNNFLLIFMYFLMPNLLFFEVKMYNKGFPGQKGILSGKQERFHVVVW